MTSKTFVFYSLLVFFSSINAGEMFTVLIDPGHGGSNKGAVKDEIIEKEITLEIGLKLKTLFASSGKAIKTIFTRTSDIDLPAKKRAELINSVKPDIFISLHFNSQSFLTTNRGFEIYYPADTPEAEPIQMVKNMERANCSFHYGNIFKEMYLKNTLFTTWNLPFNMFTQKYDLLLFDETTVPGLLLEIAYLTSPEDRACVENSEFIDDAARFIFDAIVRISNEKCH